MRSLLLLWLLGCMALRAEPLAAPNPDAGGVFIKGPDGQTREIHLGPDDRAVYPPPPAGFDLRREGIPHGKMEKAEYDSKTVGARRRMLVYTPPGAEEGRRFPVLYLLHGIGGDETEWQRYGVPEVILDNLLAEGKAVPMILVMPNGRAAPDDRPPRQLFTEAHRQAFAHFERDLLDDLIPAVEAHYPALTAREQRGLAGLSMGGGQALNFGLTHLDYFAWVGAFSPAPDTRPPAELLPDAAAARARLKLLWLSCGNRDGLIGIAQGVHAYCKSQGLPHVWQVDGNAHDTPEWRASFYHFAQLVFR